MAKLTPEQVEERVLGFIDRENGRDARITAAQAVGQRRLDTTQADIASKYGPEIYTLMEEEAIKARDGLVRVLEHCGVRFDAGDDRVSRVRFEAIAVGVNLAMRQEIVLHPDLSWLDTPEFRMVIRTEASNSKVRLAARVEFVRDRLLRRR